MSFSLSHVAWRNLGRRPVRSIAIILGIAALAWSLFTITMLYFSMTASIRQGAARLGADAMAVPAGWEPDTRGVLLAGGPTRSYMDAGVVERLRGIRGVQDATGQLFIISAQLSCCSVSDTRLIGFEPDADFTITPWLREHLPRRLAPEEVVVGANILAEPGGRLRFYGREFLIAGKLDPTGTDLLDSSVFVPMPGARRMIARSAEEAEMTLNIDPSEISAALIRFGDHADPDETALRIEHEIPEVSIILAAKMSRSARRVLLLPLRAILAAGIVQWAVSLVLIGVMYGLSLSERTREVALMRAMGARPRTVLRLFLVEVLLLSAAGAFVGAALGGGLLLMFRELLRQTLDVPFVYPQRGFIALLFGATVAFTVLCGLLATVGPIRRAVRQPPVEAVQRG